MNSKEFLALAIFALTYLIILAGENSPRKLDRPTAGLLGAVLMVATGVLTRREAAASLDLGTLALLFGMMIITGFAVRCGLLEECAAWLVQRSRSPVHLLWIVILAAGGLSALFVNDTICLLMTPLLLSVANRNQLPPEPYLLALATSSNVGSVMTLTGNPQNMLIGQSSGWGWGAFALRMAPVGLLCLGLNGLVLTRLYGRELRAARLQDTVAPPPLRDPRLARKTLLVLIGLLIAFLAGAPMDVSALVAAGVLLVWANEAPAQAFAAVDWPLLVFFAGLFVVVEGVVQVEGRWVSRALAVSAARPDTLRGLAAFSGVTVLGSNLFSNVPFVMLARHWVAGRPHASSLWLALAASSTLAGNLTLVGSIANMIVAQGASPTCRLGFRQFARAGVPTTLLTVAASVLVLWLYTHQG
jgi:Na+/H+ antiporter NhaD/arsenite permease-like protein